MLVIPKKDSEGNILNTNDPFATKEGHSFEGRGLSANAVQGQTTNISFVIPDGQTFDIDGLEVLNGRLGDTIDLKVVDAEGAYTGTAGTLLNQFGFDWNAKPEMLKKLSYSATLLQKMEICVCYTNNDTADRTIYVNLDLHKKV